MTRTLYAHTEDLLALEALLEEHEGTDDEAVNALLSAWWTEQSGELAEKVDRILALAAETRARAKARKEEAARLASRAKRDEHAVERLERLVLSALDTLGMPSLETRRFTAATYTAGNAPVVVDDVKALPPEFVRQPAPEPKKAEIAAALKAGVAVPGARFGDRARGLRWGS